MGENRYGDVSFNFCGRQLGRENRQGLTLPQLLFFASHSD